MVVVGGLVDLVFGLFLLDCIDAVGEEKQL